LTIDLPSEPVWIDADLTRLSQVVANLLNNAAKYTPPNGQIRLSVHLDESEVVIDVTDSGVGIPFEMQSQVFELFTQIGNTNHDRSQGGLGIGLALVKQLVELHDGTVSAESAGSGKGSKFSVRIPRAPDAKSEVAASETPSLTNQTPPLKVLVIDDNPDVSLVVGYMLEEIGHEFQVIHDGPSALDAARDFKPDVVLLDIGLPGMNGYEVCRAFRQDPQFETLPIIAQTGWGHDQDKASARDAGFNYHLTKPVSLEELERVLDKFQRPVD
jgi:CheY-like chemotaxis protein/anti-sigma regulatory factor (Ser/Thr protein kinase)